MLLAFCTALAARGALAQITLPSDFADQTIVSGLTRPNGLAILPDGRVLFTELTTGKIRMVVNGHIAATDPIATVDSLNASGSGERGLQGIAVDPRWPQFPYVYVGYTHLGDRSVLVRFTATGDVSVPNGENMTLGSKRILIHNFVDNQDWHNGLGLRFGTDGKLFMTTGDDGQGCASQSLGSMLGKLFRLDVSRIPAGPGGPCPRAILTPSDNPYVGPDSNAALVYAQGLRNPWRFHVDVLNGAIVLADVGEGQQEELDDVIPRANYGWPYREANVVQTYDCCLEPPSFTYDPPFLSADHALGYQAILTAGIYRPAFGGASNWPSTYQGSLFYCDYFLGKLRRMIRIGSSWVPAPPVTGQPSVDDWGTGFKFSTDFGVGADGSLWWLKDMDDQQTPSSGMLKRIRYTSTVGVPYGPGPQLTLAPNPFSQLITLQWVAASAAPATVEIFDMAGRRVHGSAPTGSAGPRSFVWNAKDDQGNDVPTGMYVIRVRHDGQTETQRALRVR